MTPFLQDQLLDAFASALARALGQPVEPVRAQVKPAQPEHGDLAFPTFPLAKQLRKPPPAIAAELAGRLAVPGLQTGPSAGNGAGISRHPRRWPALAGVVGALLLRVGLDVLKPWPMVFLVDYVLRGQSMPSRRHISTRSSGRTCSDSRTCANPSARARSAS